MNSRFSFALVAGVVCALPAAAEECLVCDPEIVMTQELARCFLDQAASNLNEMQQKGLPYQLVNLGKCEEVESDRRGTDSTADGSRQILSWSDIRNARAGTPNEPTITFIMDRAGILCLEAKIRENLAEFDPSSAFRPAEMCPP